MLLCNQPLCFLSILTLMRLSMAKSKISPCKCHIALENTGVILKQRKKTEKGRKSQNQSSEVKLLCGA